MNEGHHTFKGPDVDLGKKSDLGMHPDIHNTFLTLRNDESHRGVENSIYLELSNSASWAQGTFYPFTPTLG